MKTDPPTLYQLSCDTSGSVSSLWHNFHEANMCVNQKEWPDRLTFYCFQNESCAQSAHLAKFWGCVPIPTNTLRGSCWGTLHWFTPFLRLPEIRLRLGSPPLAFPSPSPGDMKTVPTHTVQAKQIQSLIRNVKFYAASLFTMIILMQSSHEWVNNFKVKFMQAMALWFGS